MILFNVLIAALKYINDAYGIDADNVHEVIMEKYPGTWMVIFPEYQCTLYSGSRNDSFIRA